MNRQIAVAFSMIIIGASLSGCMSESDDTTDESDTTQESQISELELAIEELETQLREGPEIQIPPKFLVITIDTEAQYPRAAADPVQELIYGNFSNGSAGIIEMMDVADDAGVKLTFFVDVLEEYLYPGEIRQVMQDIASRNHDIQLHQHPWLIPNDIWAEWEGEERWTELNAEKESNLTCWSAGTAEFLVEKMTSIFVEENISLPIASRGGSYRFNANILQSFQQYGVNYSYNYNPPAGNVELNFGRQDTFQWSNGVYEIPISYMPSENNEMFDSYKRFDESYWNSTTLPSQIDSYFNESNEGSSVLVMMLHSWSLLGTIDDELDGSYNYVYDGEWREEAFANFFQNIPDDVTIITASELAEKMGNGEITHSSVFDTRVIENKC